jgi:hypothetical protein
MLVLKVSNSFLRSGIRFRVLQLVNNALMRLVHIEEENHLLQLVSINTSVMTHTGHSKSLMKDSTHTRQSVDVDIEIMRRLTAIDIFMGSTQGSASRTESMNLHNPPKNQNMVHIDSTSTKLRFGQ